MNKFINLKELEKYVQDACCRIINCEVSEVVIAGITITFEELESTTDSMGAVYTGSTTIYAVIAENILDTGIRVRQSTRIVNGKVAFDPPVLVKKEIVYRWVEAISNDIGN